MTDHEKCAYTDEGNPLSPSQLGLYLECPRKYEFDYDWEINTPDQSTRNLDFGSAIHTTIEWLCARVRAPDPTDTDRPWRDTSYVEDWSIPWDSLSKDELTDDTIRAYAEEEFEAAWEEEISKSVYLTQSYYEYERQVAWHAVLAYLNDRGFDDVRQTMGVEVTLKTQRDGMALTGRIDNIIRTDEGIELVDYKRQLKNIISWKNNYLEEHRSGTRFAPRRVKSLIQAGVYIEAARESILVDVLPEENEPPQVDFTFYGLLGYSSSDVEDIPTSKGIVPEVNGKEQSVEAIYDANRDTLWTVIEECYSGIRSASFEADDRLEERVDETVGICDKCRYNDMCPEVLELEVSRIE